MTDIIPYIPPAVLRQNATGSYKMRLSIEINPKLCQQRVQLGLGTKNRPEAEEIAIAACQLFMQTGLCSRKCLKIVHETEKGEFFLLKNEEPHFQTTSISENSTEKYDFHLPGKSKVLPLYKEGREYKFTFSLIKEKSSEQRNFIFNTKKRKKKTAVNLAEKIINITSKVCSYTIPRIHVFCLKKQTIPDKKTK